MADRNREMFIKRLQDDPRLGGDKVIAAAALMRISVVMLMSSGVIGLIFAQLVFGEGAAQFAGGLVFGYLAYLAYLWKTLKEPRVIGVVAVLTNKKITLLGSRKAGIVGEWKHQDIESVELIRKGNIMMMGKVALTPVGDEPITFLASNRRLGRDFVTQFQDLRRRGR